MELTPYALEDPMQFHINRLEDEVTLFTLPETACDLEVEGETHTDAVGAVRVTPDRVEFGYWQGGADGDADGAWVWHVPSRGRNIASDLADEIAEDWMDPHTGGQILGLLSEIGVL